MNFKLLIDYIAISFEINLKYFKNDICDDIFEEVFDILVN